MGSGFRVRGFRVWGLGRLAFPDREADLPSSPRMPELPAKKLNPCKGICSFGDQDLGLGLRAVCRFPKDTPMPCRPLYRIRAQCIMSISEPLEEDRRFKCPRKLMLKSFGIAILGLGGVVGGVLLLMI